MSHVFIYFFKKIALNWILWRKATKKYIRYTVYPTEMYYICEEMYHKYYYIFEDWPRKAALIYNTSYLEASPSAEEWINTKGYTHAVKRDTVMKQGAPKCKPESEKSDTNSMFLWSQLHEVWNKPMSLTNQTVDLHGGRGSDWKGAWGGFWYFANFLIFQSGH